jgi:hypothetical protein
MIINANNREIDVLSVISNKIMSNGKSYPALKFIFGGEVTAEDLDALTSGEINISGYVHEGYNTLGEISVTVGKITTAEMERDKAEKELSTARAEHEVYKGAVETILPVLDDKTALSVKTLFPAWEIGKSYTEGERFTHNDALYKVVMAHISQADWTPDVAVTLYERIDEEHAGTADDPIPYEGNMKLENGKYYEEDGVIYLCTRDSGVSMTHALLDLVGQYVEIYTE